jgi:hypothetical protein
MMWGEYRIMASKPTGGGGLLETKTISYKKEQREY